MSDANLFHKHLDVCKRCRDNPFDLCQTGAALLKATALGSLNTRVVDLKPRK